MPVSPSRPAAVLRLAGMPVRLPDGREALVGLTRALSLESSIAEAALVSSDNRPHIRIGQRSQVPAAALAAPHRWAWRSLRRLAQSTP